MIVIKLDDYWGLLHSVASSYERTFWGEGFSDWTFDDLFQEGVLVFLTARNHYEGNRGAFSTYLFHCLNNRFYDILTDRKRKQIHIVFCENGLDLLPVICYNGLHVEWGSFLDLSDRAYLVLECLVRPTDQFISFRREQSKQFRLASCIRNYYKISKNEFVDLCAELRQRVELSGCIGSNIFRMCVT